MKVDRVEFDAVILTGGRSSRLSGVPKHGLRVGGTTLLELALQSARGARRVVVVGPDPGTLPDGVLNCRENPPFAGPAAAIAAGLSALADAAAGGGQTAGARGNGMTGPGPRTLVMACDMPGAAAAVDVLLHATGEQPVSVIAVSADGRRQPLLGVYDTAALQQSVAGAALRGALENGSVFALLANLEMRDVHVPAGSTDDVDTWDDALALGVSGRPPVTAGTAGPGPASDHDFGGNTVKSQDETLEEWCRALLQALELEGVEIDVAEILSLAGVAAHSVVRPAAPLTTFIAGYAAGLATGSGQSTEAVAMREAMGVARRLSSDYAANEASGT